MLSLRLIPLTTAVMGLIKYGTVVTIAGIAAVVVAIPSAWASEGQPSPDENQGGFFALCFVLFIVFVVIGTIVYFIAGGFGPHEASE